MNITRLIQEVQPDEIYNLAAMSHVHVSFQTPEYVGNADGLGTLRILEAVRLLGLTEKLASTKLLLLSFTVWYSKSLRAKKHLSTLAHPMQLQNSMPIGLP